MARKKVEYELLPQQHDFINSNKRYVLNSGGVGSGKTYGIVLKSLKLILENPGIFILIGAQTYPLLRDTTLREFLAVVPQEIIRNYNKTEQHFIFHNGSEVIFRSFDDPNKLKSLNLGACGIEETTDISEEIFKMLRTRMRQNNMPGCIYGATNPSTFHSWVYKYFIEKPIVDSEVIYSVSSDNRYLPKEYLADLENMRNDNPEYYERMVMGRWGILEGLVYNLPVKQRVEVDTNWRHYDRIIAGLDFGFTHPTALIIMGVTENKFTVLHEVYRRGLTSADIIEICNDMVYKWQIECIYCDTARPEIIEDMYRAGLPAKDSVKDVFEGIMFVKGLMGKGDLIVNKECTYTLREFDSYIWDSKNKIKEIPLKLNDDCLDAIRYALYTDTKRGQSFSLDFISFSGDRAFGDEE